MGIGIIGGADGPTQIFITSKTELWLILGAAVMICSFVIFLIVKKRKRGK